MDNKDEVMPGFLPLEVTDSPEGDEFIPLMTNEDEESLSAKKIPDALPILPLRNTVLFPGVVIPITVGRDKSIKAVREAYAGDKIIGVLAQLDASVEEHQP